MAYQSLYRRYRPQTFGEIRGQRHVVSALQNAVVKGEVGHAYLFHGPRGTGKTTSARVLAKALNCENLSDQGEPCGECESCLAIEQGRSFDLHELDAASNNKVEDMRDLLSKVNLGTPGRAKVYILDEVHMLTSQAENALLKTLEEPPDHVTWVLATTEPHKVVETIRSRCQVFQLTLLGAEEMAEHVEWVINDAQLEVGEGAVAHVVASGGGSVRDTLSALDRVVAAGGVVDVDTSTDVIVDAIASHDVAAGLAAVGDAMSRGRDPRTIGEGVLAGLRDAFLVAMGSGSSQLMAAQTERAQAVASSMSPAALTRSMETLGTALVAMRQAPDPRVDLEVALVRLCRPAADRSLDALTDRVEQLERALQTGVAPSAAPAPVATLAPTPAPASESTPPPVPEPAAHAPTPPKPAPSTSSSPVEAARQALAETLAAGRGPGDGPAPEPPPIEPVADLSSPPPVPSLDEPPASTSPAAEPDPAPSGDVASIVPSSPSDVVRLAKEHLGFERDYVVGMAKEVLGPSKERTTDELVELWQILVAEHESGPTPMPAEDEPSAAPPASAADDIDDIDVNDLVDAPDHTEHIIERLTEAFPGAELQTTDPTEEP